MFTLQVRFLTLLFQISIGIQVSLFFSLFFLLRLATDSIQSSRFSSGGNSYVCYTYLFLEEIHVLVFVELYYLGTELLIFLGRLIGVSYGLV